jgi:hypothetical protein
MYEFKKPENWKTLPLYAKVKIYGHIINKNFSPFVDKLEAKNIVIKLCSEIKVAKVIRELKGPYDFTQSDINSDCLLKASHGSGWIIDLALIKDIQKIKEILISWNKIYSQTEEQYKYLKPRFFIEEKINCKYSGKTGKAHDIKVHCIYGEPYFLLIRKDQRLRNYYDIEWKAIMPLEFEFSKPNNFDNILNICRLLSKPFEYVRIDLYLGDDGIYFSEFTFTPHGGKQRLSDSVEDKFGKIWT